MEFWFARAMSSLRFIQMKSVSVCGCVSVCVHMRCMCALVYVTISVALLGVWNILINQATLSLYYINQTKNVNVFNFSLFIFFVY